MLQTISKSQFKAKALEYLRQVEKKKKPLVITHEGEPVVQIVPYKSTLKKRDQEILESLRGSVLRYDNPNEPVGLEDWEALK
ncbi:MAG: prevent-host-death protein [Candidatus Blackburnbacteria bacterium RIFCSPHIGHO2_01_FULL_44_64]|uniref:Antitoxin n=1 Tax=Candidatus Blackburnbacteria bacterium RIFCSPHIGHO2_02_FULL_44_20 TaxID=1797516 RepID=A0A1G1V558_9BACT|nr:MAG: prevent-host-death protein [Candidatus Blackburnbacteria bacterium RIFCSPHIGHO2_01_FULL_44_64]OGY10501.1 MAG: prevent-host-death protein [Candidatus Blackburnbacteria bacterium RIFCSPHIGHO2_02_FULL_44_20]OGY12304.1 MAG: prevent-host-death protein [Candidatus Blackburnbacteria bacterium RIFCSPHIGHO2_12_FULL_44_25]OGY15034.1 MAG: prevent-host-death protein [Candidatus Blackburnbacteria bacterium RIFCSPLOWO2_01_FULL_44_43]OGY17289.1 MAG: prevent-host-death protein [Candidatus Blackburnbact